MDVISRRIGWTRDHHVAEYRALIEGLRLARGQRITRMQIYVDSRLVVRQVGGTSRVRKGHLKPLSLEALPLIQEFSLVSITHIPRRENPEANALADRALCR